MRIIKLYACFSVYHLYVTLVKLMVNNEIADLIIGYSIPNWDQLSARVGKFKSIRKIYTFDNIPKQGIFQRNYERFLPRKATERRYVEERLNVEWKDYSDIYVYSDLVLFTFYLMGKKIRYHLLEDGLNFYQYCFEYYSNHRKSLIETIKRQLLYRHRRIFGTSPYIIDIEVNDKSLVKIPLENVIEVSRTVLYSQLTKSDKRLLYDIFCTNPIPKNDKTSKSVLICTQPLYVDGHVKKLEIQVEIYKHIIEQQIKKGFFVTIKPHPRDEADYSRICEENNCLLIDRFIPIEVLNYDSKIGYDLALSITTTAIEMLTFVNEKKYLGFDYLIPYKK